MKDERIEDVTNYGEFIPSTFQWMTTERQREIAQHHENISDQNKKN